jgi:hypothetical protein
MGQVAFRHRSVEMTGLCTSRVYFLENGAGSTGRCNTILANLTGWFVGTLKQSHRYEMKGSLPNEAPAKRDFR